MSSIEFEKMQEKCKQGYNKFLRIAGLTEEKIEKIKQEMEAKKEESSSGDNRESLEEPRTEED